MTDQDQFILRLKSLFNIDGFHLEPEFDLEKQKRFVRDPVRFLFACDDADRVVIWRELEKRFQLNLRFWHE